MRVGDSQAYYWTDEWQADEAAAVEEIQNGEALIFDSVDDAITWLNDGTLHIEAHLEDPRRPGYCATCGCAWPCPAYGPAWVRSGG